MYDGGHYYGRDVKVRDLCRIPVIPLLFFATLFCVKSSMILVSNEISRLVMLPVYG